MSEPTLVDQEATAFGEVCRDVGEAERGAQAEAQSESEPKGLGPTATERPDYKENTALSMTKQAAPHHTTSAPYPLSHSLHREPVPLEIYQASESPGDKHTTGGGGSIKGQ